jgi:hypothetical protein
METTIDWAWGQAIVGQSWLILNMEDRRGSWSIAGDCMMSFQCGLIFTSLVPKGCGKLLLKRKIFRNHSDSQSASQGKCMEVSSKNLFQSARLVE